MEKQTVDLEQAIFHFSQDGNSSDGNEIEEITIEYKASLGLDREEDGFFVLKTNQWSVDSVEELDALFRRIRKILEK